jgi:hypothetical protein
MAVFLSPVGGVAAQFFTSTGAVLTGGKLYTYLAGTTTPATAYTSSNGATAWTNPIVLNAAGRVSGSGEIWITDGILYKFVLTDANDVLIATYDNISGINSNFISFTNQQQIVTATAGQTVFNLSISYQPGTNSLSVFVDGVNQYGPGAQYAYTETDSDTVTFVSGLHVGAQVKFTTTQQQGAGAVNASQVTYNPAGTGAVATNVQAKLRQTVSVKDFGAVSDGVIATGTGTNNTSFFQAAINSVASGGSVYVPQGVYLCQSQITVPSGVSILGDGAYVSIICTNSAFNSDGLLKLNGAGGAPTTISGIGILAQNGGAGVNSIGINSDVNGAFLDNLWVSAFKTNIVLAGSDNFLTSTISEETVSSGVGISINDIAVTVSDCTLYNCYVGLSVGGVSFVNSPIAISNVRATDCDRSGFAIGTSSNVQLVNCSCGGTNNSTFQYAGIDIQDSSYITISNFVGRIGGSASTTAYGIYIQNSQTINVSNSQLTGWLDGLFANNAQQLSISNSTFINNLRRGVYIAGGDRVIVSSNSCIAQGTAAVTDAGIYSNNSAGYGQHLINGNICTQTGGGAQDYGIYANVVNNGATTGVTNIIGNISQFNSVANISVNGVTANITQTGNVV